MPRSSDETLLRLRGLGKTFPGGIEALSGVDLAVGRGEFRTLLGPSGCGKSTILRLVAGLASPSAGEIIWSGGARPEIGFVFQDPTLMPWANMFSNVYLPLRLTGLSRRQATPRITEMLSRVGLAGFEKAYPRELSGGDRSRLFNVLLPESVFIGSLLLWEALVRAFAIPPYVLPAPSLIAATLVKDWPLLFASLLVTLRITFEALALAIIGGVGLAILLAQSKPVERAFLPFAIVLQITPIIAIAPLLLVYLDSPTAVLVCAFLVAFFPILSNTALGLASTDHNLVDLFDLYRASRWRRLALLRLPSALPYFLGGLRIGGGLALIGAIVAELAAGAAGQGTGLAFRITEAGYRLNIPRMFAALALISFTGLLIYGALALISRLALRHWHDSARARQM